MTNCKTADFAIEKKMAAIEGSAQEIFERDRRGRNKLNAVGVAQSEIFGRESGEQQNEGLDDVKQIGERREPKSGIRGDPGEEMEDREPEGNRGQMRGACEKVEGDLEHFPGPRNRRSRTLHEVTEEDEELDRQLQGKLVERIGRRQNRERAMPRPQIGEYGLRIAAREARCRGRALPLYVKARTVVADSAEEVHNALNGPRWKRGFGSWQRAREVIEEQEPDDERLGALQVLGDRHVKPSEGLLVEQAKDLLEEVGGRRPEKRLECTDGLREIGYQALP
jgi:hypothetical protein